jgi:hypothetical protein
MGKYSSGIGMTDVAAMMGAIEVMHKCRVKWSGTTLGQGHNGVMHIEFDANFEVLPGSDLPRQVSVAHNWPSNAATTFEGLLYNLCWQLDYAIQKAYEQMPLEPK